MLKTPKNLSKISLRKYTAAPANEIILPPLPYDSNALEPHISQTTVETHYHKHHKGYVTRLNGILAQNGDRRDLTTLIKNVGPGVTFNMAAQVYNHTFYWESMRPDGGGAATGEVAAAIERDFGNFNNFKEQFTKECVGVFGSGWVWLVKDRTTGGLKIVPTSNAGCPLTDNQVPLLTCDVWEHAYYVDYKSERAKYIDAWWKLVNWQHANQILKRE